jgi:hypothetical protein
MWLEDSAFGKHRSVLYMNVFFCHLFSLHNLKKMVEANMIKIHYIKERMYIKLNFPSQT